MLENLALGFSVAFSAEALLYCALGVFLGTFIGVLPGVGVMAGLAMLMPLTFHLDVINGLIMLAGIYYGAAYGGSTASILLNIPGTPQTAVAALEGYPMTKKGQGGIALFLTTVGSFYGSFVGLLLLVFLSPYLVDFARKFGAQEYFALMMLGLVGSAVLASQNVLKALAMIMAGIALGLVGTDAASGAQRLTFGFMGLYDGLSLAAIALALFGIPEIVLNARKGPDRQARVEKVTFRSMLPTREIMDRSWWPMARGAGIGSVLGILPGTGALLATFLSYSVEKKLSPTPEKFGTGEVEGLVSPETSNNAAIQAGFIPTLTLGVPGDAIMALMMTVMFIHGITPGPSMLTNQPELFWGLAVSFLIGNVMLVILNVPLIGLWVKIIDIPYHYLYPLMIVFICIGVFSVNYSYIDLIVLLVFGIVGCFMRAFRFEVAPLLLGMVLGPLMEVYFRRAMTLSRGDLTTFVQKPISAVIVGLIVLILTFQVYKVVTNWRATRPGMA